MDSKRSIILVIAFLFFYISSGSNIEFLLSLFKLVIPFFKIEKIFVALFSKFVPSRLGVNACAWGSVKGNFLQVSI